MNFIAKPAAVLTFAIGTLFMAPHGLVPAEAGGKVISGPASWYGPGFQGRRTANGERFDQNALTAAHRSLPFGTKVKVTCRNSGRSVTVRINDRGPFTGGRVIDLSRAAASKIGIERRGVGAVSIEVLA